MMDTDPLPLPPANADPGAPDERRVAAWIEPLLAAGVEPRVGVVLAGHGLAEAAAAAARLVGPRGRVVALVRDAGEASAVRDVARAIGADHVESWDGVAPIRAGGAALRLALDLSGPTRGETERHALAARLGRSLEPPGRVVVVNPPAPPSR